jgi:hypothetical protein
MFCKLNVKGILVALLIILAHNYIMMAIILT